MPAFHHLNGQLFMPAKWLREMELHGDVTIGDEQTAYRRGWPVEKAFWNRKQDEAISSGIYRSVQKEGIVNPVKVAGGRSPHIVNGFHRVASMDDLHMVPITYDKEAPEAQSERLPAHMSREDEEYRQDEDDDDYYSSRSW